MSNLYERAIEYAKNARETLIDRYSSSAGGAKGGKAIWVGYDSQGKGIVKQEGVTKTVNVEGRISLPPGATVMVDENGTISVRQPSKPDPKKKAIEPKKKKRRVLKKNRPLIITSEEQEILIENVEYQLSSVWVSRNQTSGWVYIYSSNLGQIGSYNIEGYFAGFSLNYYDLNDEVRNKMAQLKEAYWADLYDHPRYEHTNVLYASVPRRQGGIFGGYTSGLERMSCYIIDNKLYVIEFPYIEILSEFNHVTYIVNTQFNFLAIVDEDELRFITIAMLSGVSVYTLDLLTLEEDHNVEFYLEQTLDVSGLNDFFRTGFPFFNPRWTGTIGVNKISRDPDQVIKDMLPSGNPFKNCENSIWIKPDEEVSEEIYFDKKPEIGAYVHTNTNFVGDLNLTYDEDVPFFGYLYDSNADYRYWTRNMPNSSYFRSFQIDCFARASTVIQNLENPEEFLNYYFRANRIDIFLDGVAEFAIMAHAFLVEDFDFCTQSIYLNSTWEGSVPKIGEDRSFASIVRDRTDHFYSSGLAATVDIGTFTSQPNLTAFLDPNSLTYGRNTVEVAPVAGRKIFDVNLTDFNGGTNLDYVLNLIPLGERVDFTGYILHEVSINQQSGTIQQ